MKNQLVILLALLSVTAFGQANLKIQTKPPFYVSVNNAMPGHVYDIHDGFLSLEYFDKIGVKKDIQLTIYDWKLQLLGNFTLDKAPGLNHYSFNLADLGITPGDGATYRGAMKDEDNNSYEFVFRNAKKPDNLPVPTILLNPIQFDCKDVAAVSLIEFEGRVAGGNAPYLLDWYVINEAGTHFLYQPLEAKLDNPSATSIITVDKQPVYKVMLLATDACGNSGRQMVVVSCGVDSKKINTLFVEPLNNLNSIADPIGH